MNRGRAESRWNLSKGICKGVRWTGFHRLYSFCFLLKRAIGLCFENLYKQKIASTYVNCGCDGSVVIDIDIETTMKVCNAVTCLYWFVIAHVDGRVDFALLCFDMLCLALLRADDQMMFPSSPSSFPFPSTLGRITFLPA